jgi:hypothetical protein
VLRVCESQETNIPKTKDARIMVKRFLMILIKFNNTYVDAKVDLYGVSFGIIPENSQQHQLGN